MSSDSKTHLLPFIMTAVGPWVCNLLLIALFKGINDLQLKTLTKIDTSEKSMNLLYFQCGLQSIQVIFFLVIQFAHWSRD